MFHKILVVDDSPHIRRAIRSEIEDRTEWVVLEAQHGKMAILMVGTHKPHLVLLDLSMPVMNGLRGRKGNIKDCPNLADDNVYGASGRGHGRGRAEGRDKARLC